ncbi:Transglycosylase SLT domain-containing protein [Bifidobacterium pseudolongum subsp. globosum]|uniref:Transglycosylase SLT domain-containing protein n=1 Tax=Bifidobacterium pseudolongum subsp. globosum TaxID=1690 RepID=A0A2N3QHJ0_9BIFI|nr:tape measure protein [Bifidobacterium pseudolongum]PKU90765.1 Transglycosylase SLT domain-containing protein [Bifidobacterium pseudolongum subsp. globosum]
MPGTAAWIDVIPNISQFGSKLVAGTTQAAQTAGRQAGNAFAEGMNGATNAVNPLKAQLDQLTDKAKTAATTVRHAKSDMAAADDQVRAATLRVEAAQARYNETLQRYGAGSSQALNAQARLATAQGTLAAKTRKQSEALDVLKAAQSGLTETQKQLTGAQQRYSTITERTTGTTTRATSVTGRFTAVLGEWRARAQQAASSADSLGERQRILSDISTRAAAKFAVVSQVFQSAWFAITSQVSGAVNRVDQLNNFPRVMANLGYSSRDASASITQIGKALDGLPSSTNAVAGMVQQLAPLTKNLHDATNIALAFNDALLAGGANTVVQSNAMMQYQQMLAAGKVDMAAWKSVEDAMPGQLNQLAKSLLGAGANSRQLYTAMQSGKISFQQFNDAVVQLDHKGGAHFSSFHKQAQDATGGIGTAMTNVKNRIQKAIADIIQSIGAPRISSAINKFSSGFETFGKAIAKQVKAVMPAVSPILHRLMGMVQSFTDFTVQHGPLVVHTLIAIAGAIAAFKVTSGVVGVVKVFRDLPGILGLAAHGVTVFGKAFSTALGFIKANPIIALISIVAMLIVQTIHWLNTTKQGHEVLKKTGEVFQNVANGIGKAWNWLAGMAKKVGTGISNAWQGLVNGFKTVGKWFKSVGDGIARVWDKIKTPIVNTVKIILAIALFPLVAAIRTIMWLHDKLAGPISRAWGKVSSAIRNAWKVINTHAIQPIKRGIKAVGDACNRLYTRYVRPAWDLITKRFNQFRAWLTRTFVKAFHNALDTLKRAMSNLRGGIQHVWDDITGVFHRAWQWIDRNVNAPFRRGMDSLGRSAQHMRDMVSHAWNAIKDAAATPVRFVVNTVYMHGIRKVWDDVADAVGLKSLELPAAHFANGTVVPGYAPGIDSVHAMIGAGEAVMVPEWVRAVGADNVYRWNSLARRGGVDAVRRDMGVPRFANGGIWHGVAHLAKTVGTRAVDWLHGVAGNVKDFLAGPGDWIKSHILGPVTKWLNGIGHGHWGQIIAQLPLHIVQAMIHKVGAWADSIKAKLGFGKGGAPAAGGTGGQYHGAVGGGVEQWRGTVLRVLKELHQPASWADTVLRRMNQESGGNPNAINNWDSNAAAGIPSQGLMQTIPPTFSAYAGPYASRGITDPLANIYAGCNYAINRYGSLAGMNRPGGYRDGGIIPELRPTLYDHGGVLPTGLTLVSNQTGHPETVLNRTPEQAYDNRPEVNFTVNIPADTDPYAQAAIWIREAEHTLR